jgi:hypothetical protein
MKCTHVALVVVLGGAACAPGQTACTTVTQSQRANVDRVGDGVLVNGVNHHTFFITTNPEIQHLRILDLTESLFVQSPNKFFPASIHVGPETRRIARAPNDESRVFALDAADAEVFEVRTQTAPREPGVDFTKVGNPIQTNPGPADLAAFRNPDGSTQLFVTIPDAGQIQVLTLNDGNPPPSVVSLGAGSAPNDIKIDPFGDTLVVTDSALDVVHVIDRASIVADPNAPDIIDVPVGGPTNAIGIGVVNVGDGDASVAVVTRADANVVDVIRLFRPGFREDRVQLLGSVELPAYPLSAYVPDNRETSTICCRQLPTTAIDANEATNSWAAVGTADGRLVYLRIAPAIPPARNLVRLFDQDTAVIALGTTSDSDWSPQTGDENHKPIPGVKAVDNFGDPPFVPFLSATETLALIWEGPPPGLESVSGSLNTANATFAPDADVQTRGARVGDIVIVQPQEDPKAKPTGCQPSDAFPQTGTIQGFSGSSPPTIDITPDHPDEFKRCTVGESGNGAVTLTVGVANAFVVFRGNGDFLGRLSFSGADAQVNLPGGVLTVTASSSGPPQVRGSQLQVPINPHLTPVNLPLSDPPVQIEIGGGGFGSAGFLPIVIVGGEMNVPAVIAGAVNAGVAGVGGNVQQQNGAIIQARRMQIGTGSEDANGLNAVFSCDEGESIADFCDVFR